MTSTAAIEVTVPYGSSRVTLSQHDWTRLGRPAAGSVMLVETQYHDVIRGELNDQREVVLPVAVRVGRVTVRVIAARARRAS